MKKIILFISVVILATSLSAQTASTIFFNTGNSNLPAIASNFDVPINVAGFDASSMPNMITAIVIYFEYDNTILDYTGFTNSIGTLDYSVTEFNATTIKVEVYNWSTGFFNVPDGKLVDLQFDFLGGTTTLVFTSTGANKCVWSDENFVEQDFATLTDGAVQGGYYATTIDGGAWNTGSNWSTTVVPNAWANATVTGTGTTTISAAAVAHDVTVVTGGMLTLTNTLTAGGDFLVESAAGTNGSYINNGGTLTVTGSTTVQSYVTAGQWHGISPPVTGLTAYDYAFSPTFNPEVWLKYYNEATDDYTNIITDDALVDMKGYMTWIGSSATQTYDLVGNLRTSASIAVTNGFNGWNFVGNPFSSAIDWDAASGWTGRTNVINTVYVWNDGNWATYIDGTGVNGGSRYIAMNQGFFVNATTPGTLGMSTAVCVHDDITFKNANDVGQIIRLQVADGNKIDESVVRFKDGATVGFDGDFDAPKMLSFVEDYPQLYSTANDFMAINSLPIDYSQPIAMDVVGADGHVMTISVTEADDFEELYLKDEFTDETTDLILEDYSFTYNANITDRFTLFFSITDVNETEIQNDVRVFAYDQTIQVNLEGQHQSNISVYNLIGQKVVSLVTTGNQTLIPMYNRGYYIVKVSTGNGVTSQKVYIK